MDINLATTGYAIPATTAGFLPGDSMTRAVTLTNTAASSPLSSVTLATTATVSSILDTNTTNGLQLSVKSCSQAWTQGGTATAPTYTCAGTVTDLGTTPVVSNRTLRRAQQPDQPGGTDHLTFTISLPSGRRQRVPGQVLDAEPRLHRHPARRRRPLRRRPPPRTDEPPGDPAMTAVLPARAPEAAPEPAPGRGGAPAAAPAWSGPRSGPRPASPAAGRCGPWSPPPSSPCSVWPSARTSFGYRTMTMLTGSMAPASSPGTSSSPRRVDVAEVEPGMVISYHIPIDDHRVVTHRVVDVQRSADGTVTVQTQGDANDAPDPWTAVLSGDTAWQMMAVVPEVGDAITALRDPAVNRALVYGAPALLAGWMLLAIWRPARDEDDAEDEDAEADPLPDRPRSCGSLAELPRGSRGRRPPQLDLFPAPPAGDHPAAERRPSHDPHPPLRAPARPHGRRRPRRLAPGQRPVRRHRSTHRQARDRHADRRRPRQRPGRRLVHHHDDASSSACTA